MGPLKCHNTQVTALARKVSQYSNVIADINK